jgi:tetratricopeptide (TPR) repeat protein
MENLAYIESYFNNELPDEEKIRFGEKVTNDKNFAEEVAFYCSIHRVAKDELNAEKKEGFKRIYQREVSGQAPGMVRHISKRIWIYSATAAALVIVIFGWYLMAKPVSPQQLADKFIKENFSSLSVTMDARQNDLQSAIGLYNAGKLTEALEQFEIIMKSDSSQSNKAKNYAGIVYLEMKNYDKALACFTQLEDNTYLFSNPAKLYKAITLMRRNNSGDADSAKILLQQIVQKNLEGKETAEEWLKEKW